MDCLLAREENVNFEISESDFEGENMKTTSRHIKSAPHRVWGSLSLNIALPRARGEAENVVENYVM